MNYAEISKSIFFPDYYQNLFIISGPVPSSQQTQPTMFIPSNNIVDAFGANPLLAGATVRYGQKILGQVVDENVGKYTSGISAQIKCYFAVDTRYVISKLGLLLFPFAHTVSIKCTNKYKLVKLSYFERN